MAPPPDNPGSPQPSDTAKVSPLLRYVLPLGLLAVIAAGVLVWRYSPLNQLLEPENLKRILEEVRSAPFSAPVTIGFFVVLSMLGCPVLVLTAATSMAFGPWSGLAYSLTATVLSAAITFALGSLFANGVREAFGQGRINRLNQALGRHGLVTATVIRIAPIAPFPVLNLIAGASLMKFLPYTLGTFAGVLLPLAAISGFGGTLEQALSAPSLRTLWLPVAMALGWLVAVYLLHRFIRNRARKALTENR